MADVSERAHVVDQVTQGLVREFKDLGEAQEWTELQNDEHGWDETGIGRFYILHGKPPRFRRLICFHPDLSDAEREAAKARFEARSK